MFTLEHGDGSHGLVFPTLISWLQILLWLPYEFTWLQTQPIHVRDHHDGSLKGQEDGFMRFSPVRINASLQKLLIKRVYLRVLSRE